MDVALWGSQLLLGVVFSVSAVVKGTQTKQQTIEWGMTGVVDVPVPVMRFTAVCEALAVIGLFAPLITGTLLILTPLAAIGLGVIMVCAAGLHLRLGEAKTAVGNAVLLGLCLFVAYGRWPQ